MIVPPPPEIFLCITHSAIQQNLYRLLSGYVFSLFGFVMDPYHTMLFSVDFSFLPFQTRKIKEPAKQVHKGLKILGTMNSKSSQ